MERLYPTLVKRGPERQKLPVPGGEQHTRLLDSHWPGPAPSDRAIQFGSTCVDALRAVVRGSSAGDETKGCTTSCVDCQPVWASSLPCSPARAVPAPGHRTRLSTLVLSVRRWHVHAATAPRERKSAGRTRRSRHADAATEAPSTRGPSLTPGSIRRQTLRETSCARHVWRRAAAGAPTCSATAETAARAGRRARRAVRVSPARASWPASRRNPDAAHLHCVRICRTTRRIAVHAGRSVARAVRVSPARVFLPALPQRRCAERPPPARTCRATSGTVAPAALPAQRPRAVPPGAVCRVAPREAATAARPLPARTFRPTWRTAARVPMPATQDRPVLPDDAC